MWDLIVSIIAYLFTSQMKTCHAVPDYRNMSHFTGVSQQYIGPHQHQGVNQIMRPPFVYQQFPSGMPYQPIPTAYLGIAPPRFPMYPPPTGTPIFPPNLQPSNVHECETSQTRIISKNVEACKLQKRKLDTATVKTIMNKQM